MRTHSPPSTSASWRWQECTHSEQQEEVEKVVRSKKGKEVEQEVGADDLVKEEEESLGLSSLSNEAEQQEEVEKVVRSKKGKTSRSTKLLSMAHGYPQTSNVTVSAPHLPVGPPQSARTPSELGSSPYTSSHRVRRSREGKAPSNLLIVEQKALTKAALERTEPHPRSSKELPPTLPLLDTSNEFSRPPV